MSIKSDRWIREMALSRHMIEPFTEKQISMGKISYGLSSYGSGAYGVVPLNGLIDARCCAA